MKTTTHNSSGLPAHTGLKLLLLGVVFIVSSALFDDWDDFKAGLAGEPEPRVSRH